MMIAAQEIRSSDTTRPSHCNDQGAYPFPRSINRLALMKHLLLAGLLSLLCFPEVAVAQRAEYDALVATHAAANAIPVELVHRVIVRESRYQPHLVGRGGTIGLMQIKLATARGLGYTGDAAGLRDPNTNLTYGVRYLAGAYRVANGDANRAIHYYAAGYYYVAKRQRLEQHPPLMLIPAVPPGPTNSPGAR
jgi:soluble lytic murein transglycosylase-like protein